MKKILKFEKEEVVPDKKQEQVFNFLRFKQGLSIKVTSRSEDTLEMELSGIDAALVNALRRIIIAEIPTLAFHKVLLFQNTSVLPDELLVHRLGLLPLAVDPNFLSAREEGEEVIAENSLKFELK